MGCARWGKGSRVIGALSPCRDPLALTPYRGTGQALQSSPVNGEEESPLGVCRDDGLFWYH